MLFPLPCAAVNRLTFHMQELTLKLWWNETRDWSIEINGLRHEHVCTEIMEDLVEVALIVAENSLTDAETRRLQ
jgi:hypothetical protein